MSDRGEYRAIRRVLVDGKDFRKLPERARFVFLVLKLNLGPSGIETFEPEALVHTLAAQTGAKADQVRAALAALESSGWVRREDNVVWVVGQLTHDPHIRAVDTKHRKAIQRHVAGLPRLGIVRAFVDAHPEWFADIPEPCDGLPTVIEGPSEVHRSRKKEEGRRKEEEPNTEAADAARGEKAALAVAVEQVVSHRKALAPTSRPDDTQREQIKKALAWGYEVPDLCDALTGAFHDPWCQETGNHGIKYVLRDADTIDKYRARATGTNGKHGTRVELQYDDPFAPGYVGLMPNGDPSSLMLQMTAPGART